MDRSNGRPYRCGNRPRAPPDSVGVTSAYLPAVVLSCSQVQGTTEIEIIVAVKRTIMVLWMALLVLGIVELLAPRQLVDFWMGAAVTDESEVDLQPWVYTAARIEGVLIVLWALRRVGTADC